MEKIELFLSIIGVILVVVDVFLLRNSEKENKIITEMYWNKYKRRN